MKKINLTQGKVALVDDEDYGWLSQWKWHAAYDKKTQTYYAKRGEYEHQRNVTIRMHRVIIKAKKGEIVDHINCNSLDNRKQNLRICTNRQNMQNRRSKGTSKYPGVSWSEDRQKWEAKAQINGKCIHFGRFTKEREAAKAYEAGVRKHTGEELICKIDKKVK